MVMVWMLTDIGLTETMNRPSPKNEVKISPMITSTLRPERSVEEQHRPRRQPARR